jgi:flagellar motility protein MotE (MotC chaperone)
MPTIPALQDEQVQVIQAMAPADGAAILAGLPAEDAGRVLGRVPLRMRLKTVAELTVASAASVVFKMQVRAPDMLLCAFVPLPGHSCARE